MDSKHLHICNNNNSADTIIIHATIILFQIETHTMLITTQCVNLQ